MRRPHTVLLFLLVVIGCAMPMVAPMAAAPPFVGTVSFTCPQSAKVGTIYKCTWTWTSDASGNVSGNAKEVPYGELIQVEFDPSATAPTDNYDVTLLDTSGVDVIQGVGANRDTANTEVTRFDPGIHLSRRTLDLTIANAGNAKIGTMIIWVRQ